MNQTGFYAYYELRAAQHHFSKLPEALDQRERVWLNETVTRQLTVEDKVLRTPEAAAVVVSDLALKNAITDIEAQYEDSQAFLDDLAVLGLTVTQLNDLLERQLRVEQTLERQSRLVEPVSDSQARAYYDQHPQKFIRPERRQAFHLLITINPDYPENSRERVVERLSTIRQKVAEDPARFEKQARRYSECPSALRGGELGLIPRGQLYPELDKALFELALGEVSKILETEIGLHLIQCVDIQQEDKLPFDEVVGKLRDKLTEVEQQKAQRAWLRSLK